MDAGIIWDATARQYPELDIVSVPAFASGAQQVSIGVLTFSQQPTAALRFARYLGAPSRGLKEFVRFHYGPVDGDEWAEAPEITLFSGAMLRPAIEQTLKDFEAREGVRITTVYNGCGILTVQMRAGERPDGYFSCDVSFLSTVADMYLDSEVISANDIIILVQKGNPHQISTPGDLARSGILLGLAHPEKPAMGALTKNLLVALGLYDQVRANVKVESPTGDFLVNQIRTGSLDAVVVCRSNAAHVQDHLDVIPIDHPLAKATQPYAVAKGTKYKHLMTRLQGAFESASSKQRFETVGFHWEFGARTAP